MNVQGCPKGRAHFKSTAHLQRVRRLREASGGRKEQRGLQKRRQGARKRGEALRLGEAWSCSFQGRVKAERAGEGPEQAGVCRRGPSPQPRQTAGARWGS